MWVARCRAALQVWLGLIECTSDLNMDGELQSWAPKTGGRFLLSGDFGGGVRAHVGHNAVSAVPGCSPGYFFLVNGGNAGKPYAYKASHNYVIYPTAAKRALVDLRKLEPIHLQTHSVFVELG